MSRKTFLLAFSVLAGCASYDGRGLVSGQSTGEQVEAVMGPAVQQRTTQAGDTQRYYARYPFGREMYVATIGADGKLKSLEQRLTEENFDKIALGASRAEEIRVLLGPPYRVYRFPRMEREIWEYPWQGLTSMRVLLVQYSYDGVVRELYSIEDPEGVGPEGAGF